MRENITCKEPVCLKPREPIGIRNRAIIELFYTCGIRTSELCDLTVHDVDLKEQTVIIVKGNGNKSRILPIGQYATHYIGLYLDKARKYMLKGKREELGYLFFSQRGNTTNLWASEGPQIFLFYLY
jgi:site-specific recombinase XerD